MKKATGDVKLNYQDVKGLFKNKFGLYHGNSFSGFVSMFLDLMRTLVSTFRISQILHINDLKQGDFRDLSIPLCMYTPLQTVW